SDLWREDEVFEDVYRIDVPAAAYTGSSPIEVQVRRSDGPVLVAHVAGGEAGGDWTTSTRLAVQKAGEEIRAGGGPGQVANVRFGGTIDLTGFTLPRSDARPGETFPVVLFWSERQAVEQNYSVFVHIADATGKPVAQHDG